MDYLLSREKTSTVLGAIYTGARSILVRCNISTDNVHFLVFGLGKKSVLVTFNSTFDLHYSIVNYFIKKHSARVLF